MQQATVIRQLGIEVIADAAAPAQLVERQLVDVGDEVRIQDLVDASAMLVQGLPFRV